MHACVKPILTKHHRLGGFTSEISQSSRGWEVLDQNAGEVDFILRPLLLACRGLSSCVFTRSLCPAGG